MNKIGFILFTIMILLIFSCQTKNPLKNNEQELSAEIILMEEERLANMNEMINSLPSKSGSTILRVEENRSEDSANPPIVLDLIASRKTAQKVNVSDLFSGIEYIKLETVPDSNFYDLEVNFMVSDKFIYGYSVNGIAQFNFNGQFLKYICKNESYYTKYNGGAMTTREQAGQFIGGASPKLFQGKLYYIYEDRQANLSVYMEYEETSDMQVLNLPGQTENSGNIRGLGKPVMNLPQEENSFRKPEINPLGNGLVGFTDSRKVYNNGNDFFTVTSISGDTVCTFKDFDPIENYTKSIGRGAEEGNSYVLNGVLHLRQIYNDTIYKVLPPNRMIPKYVLDFGEFGIESSLEGVDPGYNLADKFVPDDFLETNNFLFFTYTKDYDCPNTAKTGSLKYSRIIYDKRKKTILPVYTDETPILSNGMNWPVAPERNIENDLEDSPFLWPHEITSFGTPYSWINGKQLDEKFQTKKIGTYSLNEKNEYVIAIYK